ncbi:MAG: helix-turn-helix transcriptional regulator [Verrucomicrobia bacterium]|nr:helix-turn-helix transcriptional regulator [Verrucomicrobiota bacterium]
MTVSQTNRRKPSEICRRFGARLRRLRKARKWSLEELAHRADIHVTYLSGLERGHRNPTLNVIAELAKALNLSFSSLFSGIQGKGTDEKTRARH